MALLYPSDIRNTLRRHQYQSFSGTKKEPAKISELNFLIKTKKYRVYKTGRDSNGKSFIVLEKPQGHISFFKILYP